MKVKKINKIMVIQWNEDGVRTDIGEQKIDVSELIKVLARCIKGFKEEYEL